MLCLLTLLSKTNIADVLESWHSFLLMLLLLLEAEIAYVIFVDVYCLQWSG